MLGEERQHGGAHIGVDGRGRRMVQVDGCGHDAAPVVFQSSSLLRTAAITASVNSSVNAWPPRSAVRTPWRTVSNTASKMAREATRALASLVNPSSAAAARIMAMGLAMRLPCK